ncbi:hypothetical protein [Flavobacterium mesophilum]|uniref:hypothetical protein n=1 Tax=Flavobacterium mesophilum TaxID=3143495 RepID=UPI0031D33708
MKKILLLIIIAALTLSCNEKTQYFFDDILDNFSFNNTLSNSTQIIIKQYGSTVTNKTVHVQSYNSIKKYKTNSKQQFESFKAIFIDSEKTSYCCCPKSSYSIHFLDQQKELDFFYVDTLEFKTKIRICESGYQYSYIVEKQKWKDFLNEIN